MGPRKLPTKRITVLSPSVCDSAEGAHDGRRRVLEDGNLFERPHYRSRFGEKSEQLVLRFFGEALVVTLGERG